MPRFFIDDRPQGELYTLTGENAHHAGRVLRLRPGETLTLCDGAGTDFDCTVEQAEKDEVVCRVQAVHPSETEPRQDMTLFMALPKGDKMEFVIQKSVELGVRKIVPFLSKNCVSRPDKTDKKVERWRKIAVEAAKQCGRGYLPVVTAVTLEGQGVSDTVSLVVGPEGGFAPEEVQAAQNAGLSSVSLGTRILRCETAPVAALAAVLYAGGNM